MARNQLRIAAVLLLVVAVQCTNALNNGLSQKPPLGVSAVPQHTAIAAGIAAAALLLITDPAVPVCTPAVSSTLGTILDATVS
jgi:hypothetical protein